MANEYIAQILKEYRKRNNLTVKDVSLLLQDRSFNAAPKTIYGWESGQSTPNAEILLTLCELYHITDVLSVFGYSDDDTFFHISTSERALIESYRKHPDMQKSVNKLLDLNVKRKASRSGA